MTLLMPNIEISIPDFCLVLLVGPSSAGKSTFAKRHFSDTEILSSDEFRARLTDDENNQAATEDAFSIIRTIANKRLTARHLTVIDATNLEPAHRSDFLKIAHDNDAFAFAIVLDPGSKTYHARHHTRQDRKFDDSILDEQIRQFHQGLSKIDDEGFRAVFSLNNPDEIDGARITRYPMRSDKRTQTGPFDIIGDVHGCADELIELLNVLGYDITLKGNRNTRRAKSKPPEGRRAVFVGDLVDRGPKSPDVLRIVMDMCEAGHAFTVPGNHDIKLLRYLNGRNVTLTHGLDATVAQLKSEPKEFTRRVQKFLESLMSHLWLDGGRLAIAHAGIKTHMLGRSSRKVRVFCFYGETSGETDEFGLPIRYNWAAEYNGDTTIIYGHTPITDPEWLNNTLCVDTGCVFGGKLTALRWPERELVAVKARKTYVVSKRPKIPPPPRPGVVLVDESERNAVVED